MRLPYRFYWLEVIILAAIYFLAAKVGLQLAFRPIAEQVTAVWPPTGIALAAMLVLGYDIWPGIALGAFLANATHNEPLATAFGIALGNTLEAVVGAWLLRRWVGFRASLERVRDIVALVFLASVFSTMISASIGVTSLCLGEVTHWADFGRIWGVWWLGDGLSDLVFAPLLMTWAANPFSGWSRPRIAELVLLSLTAAMVSLLVFAGWFPGMTDHPLEFTVFPFLIWAALRLSQPGTATLTFLISCIAIWGTIHGFGPFAKENRTESLILLQTFMGVVAITSLVMAAAAAERNGEESLRKDLAEELRLRIEELAEADRRKDRFLAMLSHELRNPLAPIRNALQILRLHSPADPVYTRLREMIERQVTTLTRLVNELLDVSRITRNMIELRKEPVPLATLVTSAVETTRPVFEERKHQLEVTLPQEPVWLDADPTRLEQVLANLLNNAARYTSSGGQVWITAEVAGNNDAQPSEVVIRVRDTGIGIRPEMLGSIFELFTQADRVPAQAQEGLGIGLTLVRSLVELHGGTVHATSPGLGQGSEFLVRLPTLVDYSTSATVNQSSGSLGSEAAVSAEITSLPRMVK